MRTSCEQYDAETMDPQSSVFGIIKSAAYDSSEQEIRNMLGSFGFSGNAEPANLPRRSF